MEDAAQKVGDDVPQVDDGIKSSKKDISRLMREGNLIESFLTATATQLTYYGLSRLYSDVKEKEVSVFFRNNHFSCMFMMEGRLYLLLTDCGYARLSNAVWELLSDVAGDTVLVNSDFVVEDMNTDDYPFSTLAPYDVAARGDAVSLDLSLEMNQSSNKMVPYPLSPAFPTSRISCLHINCKESRSQQGRKKWVALLVGLVMVIRPCRMKRLL